MEDEGKVEVDELDLELCLICVLYIILPCGFTKLLGVYRLGKEENRSYKMTIMGVEHVITFPLMNKIWLNPLFSLITAIMYIKDGMKDGRV
jgi:hypothetical protein